MYELAAWIERKGLTQAELARMVGMHKGTLSTYVLKTRKFPDEAAERIATKTGAKVVIRNGQKMFKPKYASRRKRS